MTFENCIVLTWRVKSFLLLLEEFFPHIAVGYFEGEKGQFFAMLFVMVKQRKILTQMKFLLPVYFILHFWIVLYLFLNNWSFVKIEANPLCQNNMCFLRQQQQNKVFQFVDYICTSGICALFKINRKILLNLKETYK